MTKLLHSLALSAFTVVLATIYLIFMSETFTGGGHTTSDYLELFVSIAITFGPTSMLFWLIVLPKKG